MLIGISIVPARAQDFRGINWGMSVEQVKSIETGVVLDENENMFVYAVEVAGRDALLFYRHVNSVVVGGGYSFQAQHINKNEYINDYEALKQLLTAEYGGPETEEVFWKNDRYRNEEELHGREVGMGHLVYWADWDAGNTKIELALHGNNNLHVLAMNYASVAHAEPASSN